MRPVVSALSYIRLCESFEPAKDGPLSEAVFLWTGKRRGGNSRVASGRIFTL